jgi:hypothetical protein
VAKIKFVFVSLVDETKGLGWGSMMSLFRLIDQGNGTLKFTLPCR